MLPPLRDSFPTDPPKPTAAPPPARATPHFPRKSRYRALLSCNSRVPSRARARPAGGKCRARLRWFPFDCRDSAEDGYALPDWRSACAQGRPAQSEPSRKNAFFSEQTFDGQKPLLIVGRPEIPLGREALDGEAK